MEIAAVEATRRTATMSLLHSFKVFADEHRFEWDFRDQNTFSIPVSLIEILDPHFSGISMSARISGASRVRAYAQHVFSFSPSHPSPPSAIFGFLACDHLDTLAYARGRGGCVCVSASGDPLSVSSS
jgi:hypothetical protein